MKVKILSVIATLVFFTISSLYGQNVKVWDTLYKQSKSVKDRRDRISQISDTANSDFAPLIYNILQEQLEYVLSNDVQEKKYYDEWVSIAVGIASRLKIEKVSDMFRSLYQKVQTPRIKGDVMVALGKTGDISQVDFINNELRVFNELQKSGGIKGKEDIVDGTIKALEYLKDTSSFSYLFYASLPGYAEKTRKLAKEALEKITDNASEYCNEIIRTDTDMNVVYEALKFSYNSKSGDKDKILSARFALIVGLDVYVSSDKNLAQFTKDDIRDESVKYLGNLKASDKEIVSLIEKKWRLDKTSNSNIITIEALQKIATTDSAKVLSDKLGEFNQKVKEGGGTGFGKEEGERITIAIIRALGEIKDPIGNEELLKIKTSSQYGNTVKNEAIKALDMIAKK